MMKPTVRHLLMGIGSLTLAAVFLALALTALAQGTGSLTRLTMASESNRTSEVRFAPSLSSDGTKVVFQSDSDFLNQGIEDEQVEIWLYDTTSLTLTRITTSSEGNLRQSLAANPNGDGTKIVFRSDSDFLGQGITDEQYEIWLYDTTAMTFTRITTAVPGNRRSFFPIVSDDGTKIVFESDSDFFNQGIQVNQLELWLYDTTTMTLTRITTASAPALISIDPVMNTDGSKLAFASRSDFLNEGLFGLYEIWLYDTATMSLTRITEPQGFGRDSFSPSLNGDGTKIAFRSDSDHLDQGNVNDNQFEIWLYDTTVMTLTRITTASSSDRQSFLPRLSADGTKIAFYSDSDFLDEGIQAGQFEVWLYDTTAMTFTRITTASETSRQSIRPSLSADGRTIAFQSDSDFMGQGILDDQNEIWLYEIPPNLVYLPVVLK